MNKILESIINTGVGLLVFVASFVALIAVGVVLQAINLDNVLVFLSAVWFTLLSMFVIISGCYLMGKIVLNYFKGE